MRGSDEKVPAKEKTGLKWLKVESSNVEKVRYDRKTKTLDVVFKSNRTRFYRLKKVEIEKFVDLIQAESVGSFYSKDIKAAGYTPMIIDLPDEEFD